jgi:DNA-directed RNA polymerase specialized sigma24 family protein
MMAIQAKRPGRPLTPAQKKARRLIKAHPDWSAAKIAGMCGLTRDAVQRDAVYKLRRKKDDRPAKVAAAAALVEAGQANQREAARQMGVHESAISKFRTRQKLKQENGDGNNG